MSPRKTLQITPLLAKMKGRPHFNAKGIAKALSEHERIKETGGDVTLYDIEGNLQTVKVIRSDGWDLTVRFNSLQHMANLRDEIPTRISGVSIPTHDCSQTPDLYQKLQEWEDTWKTSKFRQSLVSHLTRHAREMPPVTRIVCFGLGYLEPNGGRYSGACYLQHLAACTVRDILLNDLKHRAVLPNPPRLEVFVQDPAYCPTCKTVLRDRLDMTVIEGDYGFLKVDTNTFVLSISPNVPVRQIVTAVTSEQGGPAGMMCDRIVGDGLEHDGKEWSGVVTPYTTDDSAPWVMEYKKRCNAWALSDIERGSNDWAFGDLELYLRKEG